MQYVVSYKLYKQYSKFTEDICMCQKWAPAKKR